MSEPAAASPVARALLVLELIQNRPGIRGDQLAERLGVSDRAVRRHVAILREAGIPVEAERGRYGGYRLGRGARLPPLMFTPGEALGVVMAVLQGHGAADPGDPIGSALSKIIRVLPQHVAGAAEAVRGVQVADPDDAAPSPETTATLVQSCGAGRRLRLRYRLDQGDHDFDVDPWSVVVWRGRWYLLCWSHHRDAQRVLRIDRVQAVRTLAETFVPPTDLDPLQMLEAHLSQGWRHEVDVIIDAPLHRARWWVAPSVGRLEAIDGEHTRLRATTDDPEWYAEQLAAVNAPFRVIGSAEILDAVHDLGQRLLRASTGDH